MERVCEARRGAVIGDDGVLAGAPGAHRGCTRTIRSKTRRLEGAFTAGAASLKPCRSRDRHGSLSAHADGERGLEATACRPVSPRR